MSKTMIPKPTFPPQHQDKQPGLESMMNPLPDYEDINAVGSGKLAGKVALITGGDSGIGRAVAIAFAKEGADLAIVYRDEHSDAEVTQLRVQSLGRKCVLLSGDLGDDAFCQNIVAQVIQNLGHLDILVNNAAEQHVQNSILDITKDQLEQTFRTNIFSCVYLTKAALPHLKAGAAIINTASITAYKGDAQLIDYSASKGAVVSFTRSMSESLVKLGIRVNGIAPGPVWTPLIPASFPADQVATFGSTTPMQRAAQPKEIAPAYVYLASNDSGYMSGQILHINGGTIING